MSAERQEGEQNKEQELIPYYLAYRYSGERPAGRAYFATQETIFNTPESDLSVFRFQLDRIYHVAVLGQRPDENLAQRLQRILSSGEPVSLTSGILKVLLARRSQAIRQGPWVEKHYRPGQEIL